MKVTPVLRSDPTIMTATKRAIAICGRCHENAQLIRERDLLARALNQQVDAAVEWRKRALERDADACTLSALLQQELRRNQRMRERAKQKRKRKS